jgi:hypothetical protein
MHTLRMKKLLQPSQVERLLEACATRSGVLPEDAYQLRDPDSLPPELRRVLGQITGTGQVWTCWACGTRMWLFAGEISLDLSRERRAPVLRVSVYDEDGDLKESGTWMTNQDGTWQRCAD